jgi:hypothetical protein
MEAFETSAPSRRTLQDPFYYLGNFRQALDWLTVRYSDLLAADEREFIRRFIELPTASQALLVRMVMRTADLFRSTKLRYPEIGCPHAAAQPLVTLGWVDDTPLLTVDDMFGLLKKSELAALFPQLPKSAGDRKAEWLEALRPQYADPKRFKEWHPGAEDECIYALRIGELCDRLRLIYFGNLYQDWSEFVVSELGILAYEKVELSESSRGFQARQDIDDYLAIHRCSELLEREHPLADVLGDIASVAPESDWLRSRRERLLFRIGQQHERLDDLPSALEVYSACSYPGARLRAVRVLEKMERIEEAHALARQAEQLPEDEAERQQLLRVLPRLHRKLKLPKIQAVSSAPIPRLDLVLPWPEEDFSVEFVVRDNLASPEAPVWYVENTLVNSLFGLLCWNAVFLPLPGAFFHPFQQGPADLHSVDFVRRRHAEFAECLAQLESDQYRHTILQRYREKFGIQSPFVFWGMIDEGLLELALACIPASHLRKWFERMLADIKANRSGFPDLIQFWPDEARYRMIEVKGPGDRLQDNQIRYLDYCMANDMPVAVCHVQWQEPPA